MTSLTGTIGVHSKWLLFLILVLLWPSVNVTYGKELPISCEIAYSEKLYEIAITSCEKEMHSGNIRSQILLAKIYLGAPAEYRNTVRAYNLLIDAVNKNYSSAMIELAAMYKFGIVPVKKSVKRAFVLYKKAAKIGNPIGLVNIGLLYLDEDFKIRPNLAYAYFLLANDRGFKSAKIDEVMEKLESEKDSESKRLISEYKFKLDDLYPK